MNIEQLRQSVHDLQIQVEQDRQHLGEKREALLADIATTRQKVYGQMRELYGGSAFPASVQEWFDRVDQLENEVRQ